MGPDTVVLHLAARTGNASPAEYTKINVEGTQDLLEAAEAQKVRGLLYVSSIAASFPDIGGYPYASSKREAEEVVRLSSIRWTIVRPTIVLGRESPVWAKFSLLARAPLLMVPGNGKARIQPIHVEDLVGLLLRVVVEDRFDGETLEAGGPEVVSIEEFLRRAHRQYRGLFPGAIRVPLKPGLAVLRAAERLAPIVLPVTAGQFYSFVNDGVAEANPLLEEMHPGMRDIDAMLKELTG
jgi:NADH dehydrogenase